MIFMCVWCILYVLNLLCTWTCLWPLFLCWNYFMYWGIAGWCGQMVVMMLWHVGLWKECVCCIGFMLCGNGFALLYIALFLHCCSILMMYCFLVVCRSWHEVAYGMPRSYIEYTWRPMWMNKKVSVKLNGDVWMKMDWWWIVCWICMMDGMV